MPLVGQCTAHEQAKACYPSYAIPMFLFVFSVPFLLLHTRCYQADAVAFVEEFNGMSLGGAGVLKALFISSAEIIPANAVGGGNTGLASVSPPADACSNVSSFRYVPFRLHPAAHRRHHVHLHSFSSHQSVLDLMLGLMLGLL